MYLDNGEELLPGASLDNYVAFEALQVRALDLQCSVARLGSGYHAR